MRRASGSSEGHIVGAGRYVPKKEPQEMPGWFRAFSFSVPRSHFYKREVRSDERAGAAPKL
jgi:hypothetical protein